MYYIITHVTSYYSSITSLFLYFVVLQVIAIKIDY